MHELLIVNPSDRDGGETTLYESNPRKRRRSGRRASAKQAAWRREFGRRYGGGRKRNANPAKRRRRARRGASMASVKRGGSPVSRRAWRASGYRRNPARRYNRNPVAVRASLRSITSLVVEAAQGAVGATLVDMAMGQIVTRGWIPSTMLTTQTYPLVKGGVAIGLGLVVNMMPLPGMVKRFMAEGVKGSLVCTLRDTISPYLSGSFPLGQNSHQMMRYRPGGNRDGYMGYRTSAQTMIPQRRRGMMGEYLSGSPSSMSTRERQAYSPSYGTLGTYMHY